jgi:Homeodomain-like domain
MPKSTFVEIPPEEQAQMLAALRRARYGYLLALHILLLCAAGRTPTDIAAALFCSRSSVYRTVRAYRQGTLSWDHDAQGQLIPVMRTTVPLPTLRRALVSLLKATPRAYGWCRTRWSCTTPALTLQVNLGLASRPRPCVNGSMRSAGRGSGPSWWPKLTTCSGCTAWPVSDRYSSS